MLFSAIKWLQPFIENGQILRTHILATQIIQSLVFVTAIVFPDVYVSRVYRATTYLLGVGR